MMSEPSNGNGDRESLRHMVKSLQETLIRVELKLDNHLKDAIEVDSSNRLELANVERRLELHTSDDHPKRVAELRDAELKDQGRAEVYRYIFGASLLGFISGTIGLVATVWSLLTRGS